MSTYYNFYPAVKRGDKYKILGNYIDIDDSRKLYPIMSRSRSFIHSEDFEYKKMSIDQMFDEDKNVLTTRDWFDSSVVMSCSYLIPFNVIADMAGDGIIRGYVTLEELDGIVKSDYDSDWLWEVEILYPETIAEMDPETRKNYGQIAIQDVCSSSYLAQQLLVMVDEYYMYIGEDNLFFIMTWG